LTSFETEHPSSSLQTKPAGLGWLIGQLCLIELVAWGVLYYSFSVYISAMVAELGWSSNRLVFGFSFALIISGTLAPFIGRWIDRRGARRVMFSSALSGVLGVLLWSWTYSIWIYFVAWALIGIAMAGTLYAPAFAAVVQFHPKGSRNGILVITLIGALASTVFLPLASLFTEWWGWRSSLQVLALILASVTLPLTLWMPIPSVHHEESYRTSHSSKRKVAPWGFWGLMFSFMLVSAAGIALHVHVVVFLVKRGFSLHVAASIVGLAGVAKIGGRLAVVAGGRFSAMTLLRASFFVQAFVLALPLLYASTWAVVLMMVGFGATSGARTVLRPALIVELYGASHFGKNDGLLQMATTFAKALGPLGFGLLPGLLGWNGAWCVLILLVSMGGVLLTFVKTAEEAIPQVV